MAKTSAERVAEHRARNKGLEAAKAQGRALGTHEADVRGEYGEKRKLRIANAERYAVWNAEGRPMKDGSLPPLELGKDYSLA